MARWRMPPVVPVAPVTPPPAPEPRWTTTVLPGAVTHVLPLGDVVEHSTVGSCVCGPEEHRRGPVRVYLHSDVAGALRGES